MTRKRKRPTIRDAARANAVAADNAQRIDISISKALLLATDAHKEQRQAQGLCIACFYIPRSRSAGQAFTPWECAFCNFEGHHPNTAVPRLCRDCSAELGLCVRCGGHTETRHVSKLRRVRRRA